MKYLSYTLIILYAALVALVGGFALSLAARGDNNPQYIERAWQALEAFKNPPSQTAAPSPKTLQPSSGKSSGTTLPSQPSAAPASSSSPSSTYSGVGTAHDAPQSRKYKK